MATVGCGRLNEGDQESVKGVVIGGVAVLVVISGRNGAVVLGKATVEGQSLHWETLDGIRAGDPSGDSPLILSRGVLAKQSN
ncbi:MAG: hypothetical protein Q7T97_00420 [Burkholderiaceae bacterium]|nr:hypothetical protein [Burkholderiaceae bacterium]